MNKLEKMLNAIDAINGEDPNFEREGDQNHPKEWLYGRRMTEMLNVYDPNSSDELQIAARGQHIKRWTIPRDEFPMDRKGYLKWRTQLKRMHGDMLSRLMKTKGYQGKSSTAVATMVTKKKLKDDPESKKLEDVVCLVFLKYYFSDFRTKHEKDKVIEILKKTWGKMTEKGQEMALKLPFTPEELLVISKALGR